MLRIALTLAVSLAGWAAASAAAPEARQRAPLAGCSADGQTSAVKSQAGDALAAAVGPRLAEQIAYYRASNSLGAFAPRGWHCQAWYGANGSILVVTPRRIEPPYFPVPTITGPAITIESSDADGAGRFHVAIVAAQLFPLVASEFITRIKQEHLVSDALFDAEGHPDDRLDYLSDRFVEYATPANHTGLGTDGMFEASDLPVRGLTILNLQAETNNLIEVRIRLPAGQYSVAEAILQLEATCVQLPRGCRSVQ